MGVLLKYQVKKIYRQPDSIATETISKGDTELERKGKKNKISELKKDIKLQNVTLNDKTQSENLCMNW